MEKHYEIVFYCKDLEKVMRIDSRFSMPFEYTHVVWTEHLFMKYICDRYPNIVALEFKEYNI